jgi:hypothetical protein
MSKAYSKKAKALLLVVLGECIAALSLAFLLEGSLYGRLVLAGLWMAVILPITLGFLYASVRKLKYPFGPVAALILGIFFYDIFMPTIMSIGIPMALFNLSVVLPYILRSTREPVKVSRKVLLIGFAISTVYVFAYSVLHYGVLDNPVW